MAAEIKKGKGKLEKAEAKYDFAGFKDFSAQAFPGPQDTVRIYLDKVQLELRSDTLYCVSSKKLPGEEKFYLRASSRLYRLCNLTADGLVLKNPCCPVNHFLEH
jgi:hypothetical protein